MQTENTTEKTEQISDFLGKDMGDTLGMMQRMSRLQKLLGANQKTSEVVEMEEDNTPFANTKAEKMLFAAIPFLDMEFQKNIFVMVRLMEMQRVMSATPLQAREKQEEPQFRRQKMLRAVRPFLSEGERQQFDTITRMMQMRELLDNGRAKDDTKRI